MRPIPDWIAVDEQGRKRRHWASPEMWVTCALGPYNFEFMTEVHREIMARYRVDGIFINRWSGSGMCYCEHCRDGFKTASGHDLPRTNDPADPARRAFIVWQQERLFELWRLWDAEVRKINPDSCVIPNTGGGATSPLDMKTIGELAPILFADRQAPERGDAPLGQRQERQGVSRDDGQQADRRHLQRGRGGGLPLERLGAEPGRDPHLGRRRNRQRPAALVHQVLRHPPRSAAGWASSRTSTGGITASRNTCEMRPRWPAWAWSTRSRPAWFHRGPTRGQRIEDHILGWYQALIEARIPFEMVHDRLARRGARESVQDADPAQRRRTLRRAVPAAPRASSTGAAAWWRPTRPRCATSGERRARTSAWPTCSASHSAGTSPGPMRNSYLRLEDDPRTHRRHPILQGLEDAPRIINGTYRLDVEAHRKFRPPAADPDPQLPGPADGEGLSPSIPRTEIPQVYLREIGAGRVVYFPWDIDRVFWEVLGVDHGTLMRNAVTWATNEEPPVQVTGPGVLDVTVWRQKASMTVHLVNLTNPMMMKGPFRELLPVGPQDVVVYMPEKSEGPSCPTTGC